MAGPRPRDVPALSRDRILDAAVSLADAEGLEAVTLRRVAAELGVHVTSLYHHVPTREAVSDGIVERLLAGADVPLEAVGWEQWVRRFFAAMSDTARDHPGAFQALQAHPVQGARAAATFEVALAAFTRAGLSPQGAYGALKTTSLVALGVALEQAAIAQGRLEETHLEDLPEHDFPQVRALATVQPGQGHDFALETLVSGLRSQIRRR
jgi:AcrR family transcriptional regulator